MLAAAVEPLVDAAAAVEPAVEPLVLPAAVEPLVEPCEAVVDPEPVEAPELAPVEAVAEADELECVPPAPAAEVPDDALPGLVVFPPQAARASAPVHSAVANPFRSLNMVKAPGLEGWWVARPARRNAPQVL